MSLNGTAWTPIGPNPIQEGGNPDNGMVTAIAINPNNKNVIYIGTAGGGVWRSRGGGPPWPCPGPSASQPYWPSIPTIPTSFTPAPASASPWICDRQRRSGDASSRSGSDRLDGLLLSGAFERK